jgi:hypothetical protein
MHAKRIIRLWILLGFLECLAVSHSYGTILLPGKTQGGYEVCNETTSDNGEFITRVIWTKADQKFSLSVFHIKNRTTNEVWKVPFPHVLGLMYVSNDGEFVATLSNDFESLVALYSRHGTLAQIPRKDIIPDLTRDEIIRANGNCLTRRQAQLKLLEDHIAFFTYDPRANQWLFNLWLGKQSEWISWSSEQGKQVSLDEKQKEQLIQEARKRSIQNINTDTEFSRHFKFIAALKVESDRILIEKYLRDRNFDDTSFTELIFTPNYPRASGIYSHSKKRDLAEKALAEWDGIEWPEMPSVKDGIPTEPYRFLGTAACMITFPSMPDTNRGKRKAMIRVYLIPETIPFKSWAIERPEHYLLLEANTEKTIKCAIAGVNPGRYRIRVFWDKKSPHGKPYEVLFKPSRGDYESVSESVVEIKAGGVGDFGEIQCDHEVK